MGYRAGGKAVCTECGKPAIGRHLCRTHYNKARLNGELAKHSKVSQDEAFYCRVDKSSDCWMWTGTKNEYGYGIFLLPGEKPVRAHRYIYERVKGQIPDGLVVRHTCDTPACVNPAHLLLGTKDDNNKDTAERLRHHYGLKHWNGRLPADAVLEIRSSDESQMALAKRFKVDPSHISRIRSGHSRRASSLNK